MTIVRDQLSLAGRDPALVRVSVRLCGPDQAPVNGTTVPGGVTTPGLATTAPDAMGNWQLDLDPTDSGAMLPSGVSYMLGVSGLGVAMPIRYFHVPASGGPYELEAVELGAPGPIPTGAASQAQVVDLQNRIDSLEMAAAGFYRHVQTVASSVWTVNHGLGNKPGGIFVEDSAHTEWKPRTRHVDDNSLTLSFFVGGSPAAMTGEAHIS